jgi:hypothetical protein
MSIRRLLLTAAGMAATATALRALTPDLSWLLGGDLDLQRVVDARGPEFLLLCGVGALAWLIWAWGALGLVLTAFSGLPGVVGAASRVLAGGLLPAGARRAAALALGVGLVSSGPLLTGCTAGSALPGTGTVALAAATADVAPDWPAAEAAPATTSAGPVADWPGAPPAPSASATTSSAPTSSAPTSSAPAAPGSDAPTSDPVPDWPRPAPGDHVVLRGECLWDIAAADLRTRAGHEPAAAEVATAVHAWWQANAAVVGPDPDLLLPGQVLRPPAR